MVAARANQKQISWVRNSAKIKSPGSHPGLDIAGRYAVYQTQKL